MTKLRQQSRRRLKTWLLASVILAALSSIVIVYRDAKPNQPAESQWIHIEPKPITLRLGLVGRIDPASLMTFSAPFDGAVQEKLAEEGQRVERGQLLLQFDTTQLEIQLREALAGVLKAKRVVYDLKNWSQSQEVARARRAITNVRMNLNDTERRLTEASALFARGIVPRMEVDALEQQTKSLRLDLTAAQAELEELLSKGGSENRQIAEMELANASKKYDALHTLQTRRELVAPFTGIIMRVPGVMPDRSLTEPLQRGTHVSRGQPLFSLANLEQLRVVARVDEGDMNQVREGQAVDITGDGFDGVALNGKIVSVGSQNVASESSGSGAAYEVMVGISALTTEQQKRLKLGMSAKLSIIIYQNDNAIVIPPEAIQKEGNQLFVEYSDAENKPAQRVTVKTGRITLDGVEVFGLRAGYVRKMNRS